MMRIVFLAAAAFTLALTVILYHDAESVPVARASATVTDDPTTMTATRVIPGAQTALSMAAPAPADTALQRMATGDQSRGWGAVGRLNVDGRGFCTATLIAPDRVLTAAHCLFDRATGRRIPDERIEFHAGLRLGRAEAIRTVRRSAIAAGFNQSEPELVALVPNDVAILQLDHPVTSRGIVPFAIELGQDFGAGLTVVSYARGREDAPSLQEQCNLLQRRPDRIYVMSCDIDSGASGSAVFVRDGESYRIVSVVSAKATTEAGQVALGVALSDHVPALLAELDGTRALPRVSSGTGAAGARDAARFVRP